MFQPRGFGIQTHRKHFFTHGIKQASGNNTSNPRAGGDGLLAQNKDSQDQRKGGPESDLGGDAAEANKHWDKH